MSSEDYRFDSQIRDGDKYFILIGEDGNPQLAGTLFYYWFQSLEDLLYSLIYQMDFLEWDVGDGFETAQIELSRIVESFPKTDNFDAKMMKRIRNYYVDNAAMIIYDYGTFDELCNAEKYGEFRLQFRERYFDDYFDEDDMSDVDDSEAPSDQPIKESEMEQFRDFICNQSG